MRVGELQYAGLVIYIFDPFALDEGVTFPGRLVGRVLTVGDDRELARRLLVDAVDEADCDGDGEVRDALQRLVDRLDGSKYSNPGSKVRVLRQLATVDGVERFIVECAGWNAPRMMTGDEIDAAEGDEVLRRFREAVTVVEPETER